MDGSSVVWPSAFTTAIVSPNRPSAATSRSPIGWTLVTEAIENRSTTGCGGSAVIPFPVSPSATTGGASSGSPRPRSTRFRAIRTPSVTGSLSGGFKTAAIAASSPAVSAAARMSVSASRLSACGSHCTSAPPGASLALSLHGSPEAFNASSTGLVPGVPKSNTALPKR